MRHQLSRHSSNPLQVPSDDVSNRKYIQELAPVLEREKNRGDRDTSSVHDNAGDEDLILGSDQSDLTDPGEEQEASQDEELDSDDVEEGTLFQKDPEEQSQILAEIEDLERSVPSLKEDFKLVDRLGEGTFSSVYKAIDLNHHTKWHNKTWQGHHPPSSSAHFQSQPNDESSKVFVAIKRIYVTSSPARIQNEIALMEECRGCRHVAQLITAFREKDQIVAVMPFHRNVDFRQYYSVASLPLIQSYLRCMLRALRDIHARRIVHRDVKPANFLFDPQTGQGVLVDFGLAQKIDYDVETQCNHTSASTEAPHGHSKSFSYDGVLKMREMLAEGRKRSAGPSDRVGWLADDHRHHIKANRAGTRGFRAPEVLLKCEDQTAALDIWSVGVILLSMLSGRFPVFNANDDVEALMEITVILGRKKMEKCAQLHNRTFLTNVPPVDHPGVPWREMVERLNPAMTVPVDSPETGNPRTESIHSRATDPNLPAAYDLLEQMLAPDMTKRITARDALQHPLLVEITDLNSIEDTIQITEDGVEVRRARKPGTGEIVEAIGDDIYAPHPPGQGICARGHWFDDDTGEYCCFVIVGEAVKNGSTKEKEWEDEQMDTTRETTAKVRKLRMKEERRRRKETEHGILTATAERWSDDRNSNASQEITRSVKVRVKRLAAGEGVAIGLDPCEFHQDAVVDASHWHSHVQALFDSERAGEGEMDE